MDFADIAKKIIAAAPALGAALAPFTGGASAGVGIALSALGSVFGLSGEVTPEKLATVIQGDPEATFKLQVAEQNYKLECKRLEGEAERARLEDVQSARDMNVQTVKAIGKTDKQLEVMGWAIVLGFMAAIGTLFTFAWQGKEVRDATGILFMLVGQLATFAGMVMAFRYGTTSESAKKTVMLSKVGPVPDETCAEKK